MISGNSNKSTERLTATGECPVYEWLLEIDTHFELVKF
jgi:hypothetical protein